MTNTNSAQINYSVKVDITTIPATYTYKDAQGNSCDGSPNVTVENTEIIYTLSSSGLIFLSPNITGDTGGDLTWSISDDKQKLTIVDTDITNETACLILIVAEASNPNVPYPSPDPKIVNRPPAA
jgi:hypothetical protein